MVRFGYGVSLFLTLVLAPLFPARVWAQGQEMAPMKVNLPPSPNFDVATAPAQYPTGELSVYGLRKGLSKYLDKDVRVKGYLLELYECPAEQKKCNEDLATKQKKEHQKAAKSKGTAPAVAIDKGDCRPCDQPYFLVGDSPTMKKERALLVADYPVKDWKTGKPKPLAIKAGDPVTVSGTFAINSMTGFAASNGLIVHKKLEDASGKVLAEGNSMVPPDDQAAQMEGKTPPPRHH